MIQSPQLNSSSNGFRVITDKMPQNESVAMSVWVKSGSRSETKENCGIAHFLEHMAFKGTTSRTALDIAKQFDNIGGHFNAYTSKEATVYYAKVLKENFSVALDIISDILLNSTFDPIEIEREREVVLQEIAQTDDTPDDILFDKYFEAAYPEQQLGRPILGTKNLVKQFNQGHLRDFTEKNYHSKNMLLSVAGNIDNDAVFKLGDQYFSSLPLTKNFQKIEKGVYKGGEFREIRDLEQVHFIIGFEAFSYHDDNYYPIQILSLILGGGMSSRLFQEVREKHGLAYSISSFSKSYSDSGMLSVYSGTEPEKTQKLISIIIAELKKMAHKIEQDELERAKSQIKSNILMGMESNSSRVDIAGNSYLRYDRYVSKEEIIDKINEVTTKNLECLMGKLLERKVPITVGAIGKVENIPNYNDIQNKLYE